MELPKTQSIVPTPDGASLVRILLILRRRWRILATVLASTLALTAVHTFTTTRLFLPQATLEIRSEAPLVADSRNPSLSTDPYLWDNYYRTQESILTSPTLLKEAFKALPEAVRRRFDGSDPLKRFSDQLEIEKVRSTYIMKVGFIDPSPEYATQIVNTIVQVYLDDANRRLRTLKSGQIEILSKEALPSIRARVEEAEKKIADFQKESGFMDFEERYKLLVEKYRKYETALTEAKLKRIKTRAELDALGSYGGDGVSGLFNPAFHHTRSLELLADQRSKVAADLAKQEKVLKEKHPLVLELKGELHLLDEKIREAIQGTLKALEADLAQCEAEEKGLAESLAEVSRQMEEVGGRKWKFKQLDSELVSAKELYGEYLKKQGETAATSSTTLGSVRVVDHATVPLAPYKPKVALNLALGAMIGILLGMGVVFVVEQLDDRIQSPREVEAFLGLDMLGVIPKLTEGSRTEGPAMLDEKSNLVEFESFRGLRAELVTRLEKAQRGNVVAILSPNPSEGKSTVTVNLARALGMEGRKVLIFDADLRRPSQRKLIGSIEGPGLEDVIQGGAAFEDAVQRSPIQGVEVLGARKETSGAAELAGTKAFDDALKLARERYDFVLIDSAPVNQVSEAALVARRADAAVLVVREGQTGRGSAQSALKRLRGMEVPVLGAVLNCADPHGGVYGYGYGYGYHYSSSYGAERVGKG